MTCEHYEVSVVLVDDVPDAEAGVKTSGYRYYEADEHTAEAAIAVGVIGYAGGRSAEYLPPPSVKPLLIDRT